LFPYKALVDWFSYGHEATSKSTADSNRDYFYRREWSFTIKDDIYIRYQCFRGVDEMKEMIKKRQPHKIDIGAVFNTLPKDHATVKSENFEPVERELVFDIDMTDYDDIRTCCSGANICLKCWPYMTMAVKVVDKTLREDFGFKHILWIYSGRRGVHCWVSDQAARELTNEERGAVVDYMTVEVGSEENTDRKLKSSFQQPFHPLIKRAYSILEPYFEKCIASESGQGILAKKEQYMKILNSLPNEQIRRSLYEDWEKRSADDDSDAGIDRWRQIKAATTPSASSAQLAKKRKVDYNELEAWRYEVVFTHCYPRLDVNVSKARNHLLKSPFCVHPKTGRVCVPIDPVRADDFDPFTVPTIRFLCEQVSL
jgi:DNA primase small subunit